MPTEKRIKVRIELDQQQYEVLEKLRNSRAYGKTDPAVIRNVFLKFAKEGVK